MTDAAPQRVVVCPIDDLPPGSMVRVEAGGRVACVANVDGVVHAIDDKCLHKEASLACGRLEGDTVVCPSHWWRYSVIDGRLSGSESGVASYPAEVIDGDVVVVLPAAVKPRGIRDMLLAHARGEE